MNFRAKWYQNPETDMKEYKLYRTDVGKSLIGTISHPTTEYLFNVDVTGNGTLKFVLTAVDMGGLESMESDTYSIDYGSPPPPPPPPPTNEAPGKPTGFVVEIVTAPPPPPPPPPEGYVINDFTLYTLPVPDIPKPAKGQTIIDPLFHLPVTRITDAIPDVGKDYCQAGYPKHDIENADGTRLIIQSNSDSTWHIFNANPPFELVQTISYELIGWGRAIDCRWDATDPDVLYFTMFTSMYKYKVSTKEMTLLHDFTTDFADATGVSMNEEGCSSDDSRYWAFVVGGVRINNIWAGWLVCYDKDFNGKDNGKIISQINLTGWPDPYQIPGFSSMSPSGKYVWTGDSHFVYPRDNFSTWKNLNFNGHADMAYTKEGREVIAGFGLFKGMWSMGYWTLTADLETGEIKYMAPVGLPRYHYSGNCHAKPGWVLCSTYETNVSQGGAPMYNDLEIDMVELTDRIEPPPRVWRIIKPRCTSGSYNEVSFAKINRKGTKIWFGSRWGGGSYDVYQVDLPTTWYEDLG